MVLEVDFPQFINEVLRRNPAKDAYLAPTRMGVVATSCVIETDLLIVGRSADSLADAKAKLEAAGIATVEGQWSDSPSDADDIGNRERYVVAVAYQSSESSPGLWMDAYEVMPTAHAVLERLYSEFKITGEMGNNTFEEFLALAHPNVLILSPEQIRSFSDVNSRAIIE